MAILLVLIFLLDLTAAACPPVVHLSFDRLSQSTVLDETESKNNGLLANGAHIVPHGGKCDNAVNLQGGDILFDGANFRNIPRQSITIATWIKLETNRGIQSIFDTVGSHSSHTDGQYHLEVDDGRVRWFHRDENRRTIFSLLSPELVPDGVWTQISVTYTSKKRRARIFVNGDMVSEGPGDGLLSGDWGAKAGIGKHRHIFGNRLLRGMVDEFFIFPCELPRLEVIVLMRHCKVYFGNKGKAKPKTKTQEQASFRSSQAITTRPSYGLRTNTNVNPYLGYTGAYRPPVQVYQRLNPGLLYQRPPQQGAVYRAPPAASDFVAQNLENILASFEDKRPTQTARPLKFSNQQRLPVSGQQRMDVAGIWGAKTIPRGRGQGLAHIAYPGNVVSQGRIVGPLNYGGAHESFPSGVQRFASAQTPPKWTEMAQNRQQLKPVFQAGPRSYPQGRVLSQNYGAGIVTEPGVQKFSTPQSRQKWMVTSQNRPPLSQTPYQVYPQARTSPGSQRTLQASPFNGLTHQPFAAPRTSTPVQRTGVAFSNRLPFNARLAQLQRFKAAGRGPYAPYRAYSRPNAPKAQNAVPASWVSRPRPPVIPPLQSRPVQTLVPRPQPPARFFPSTLAVSRLQSPASWQAANARLFVPKTANNGFRNPVVKAPLYSPAVYSSPPRPQLVPRPAPPPAQAPAATQVPSSDRSEQIYDATAMTGRKQKLLSRYLTLPYSSPTNVGMTVRAGDGNARLLPREGRVVVLQPGQLIPYYKTILADTGRPPQLLNQLQRFLTSSLDKSSAQQQQIRLTDRLSLGTPRVASLWFPGDPMHVRVYTEPSAKRVVPGRARAPDLPHVFKNQMLAYPRQLPLYLKSLPYRVFYLNKRDNSVVRPSAASVRRYVTQALSSVLSKLGKKKKRKRGTKEMAKT